MLVHGVAWDSAVPALRLWAPQAEFSEVALAQGASLGLRVAPGLWCLGHTKVHGPGERTHVPCPGGSPAERGKQCGACFARDDSWLMHDFHRIVRVLEDLVTRDLGLVQQVRSAAKVTGLVEPRTGVELATVNRQHAGRVRELLGCLAMTGYSVVEEEWERPALADTLCNARTGLRHPYPVTFDGGGHGLRVRSLSGAIALVGLPDASGNEVEGSFVADLGALKGRKVEFGPHTTEIPALQDSLF